MSKKSSDISDKKTLEGTPEISAEKMSKIEVKSFLSVRCELAANFSRGSLLLEIEVFPTEALFKAHFPDREEATGSRMVSVGAERSEALGWINRFRSIFTRPERRIEVENPGMIGTYIKYEEGEYFEDYEAHNFNNSREDLLKLYKSPESDFSGEERRQVEHGLYFYANEVFDLTRLCMYRKFAPDLNIWVYILGKYPE